jgi:hypothetical protein
MVKIQKSDFIIAQELVKQENLICWKRPQGEFDIYFFSAVHNSQEELNSCYGRIRDYIAIYFQGNTLSLDVERWNIYQFHLMNITIDPDLKQVIEQDKFATRKIVLDGLSGDIDEQMIAGLIEKEVFEFSVQRRTIQHASIMDLIALQDQDLANYLQQEMLPKNEIINSLINKFGNG